MDKRNKCEKCLYWKRQGSTMTGKCHRHAPRRVASRDTGFVNDWANTNEDDFCGDFSPATPAENKNDKLELLPIKEISPPKKQLPVEDKQPKQSQ